MFKYSESIQKIRVNLLNPRTCEILCHFQHPLKTRVKVQDPLTPWKPINSEAMNYPKFYFVAYRSQFILQIDLCLNLKYLVLIICHILNFKDPLPPILPHIFSGSTNHYLVKLLFLKAQKSNRCISFKISTNSSESMS
jgi:hypothetical protein